jgi:monoamine oxidase
LAATHGGDAAGKHCAADVLVPNIEWNAYLQAMSGFLAGAGLERISVADYIAYDAASTGCNWRAPAGYGSLVAAMPQWPRTALAACSGESLAEEM